MKPLNLDTKNCSPISSNCVIWDGPDISCINLCNGDSVSDVIHKLATELCTLLDQTNVSNYDLTCLGIIPSCPPKDFQALIKLLIEKICELNNVPADTPTTESGCPDCIVSVAECFVEGTTTNMQLTDYVQAIASKICQLINEIADLQTQIDLISDRVTILENATPSSLTLPTIATGCLQNYIAGNPATEAIDIVLDTLVNDADVGYCATINALFGTGTPADILAVVNPACITGASASILNGNDAGLGTMSGDYPAWVGSPATLAETINNIWIAICDLRNITTVTFTDTPTISFTQNAGLPNYDFSANLNQPSAKIRGTGSDILGGAIGEINSASGLHLANPGYVGGATGGAKDLCNAGTTFKIPVLTTQYDTFNGEVTQSGDTFQVIDAGKYDIGFSLRLSAPVTAAIPDAPDEAVGAFGTGKGWYGGDNVSSNDQATGLTVATPGGSVTPYTVGLATLQSPTGVVIPIFITGVNGGGGITSALILNNPGGLNALDIGGSTGSVFQDGANDARLLIDGLTKPTPRVTVLAGIKNVSGGTCDWYCEDSFSPNVSTSKCVLGGTQLGVQFAGGENLQCHIMIIVNDESGGGVNNRWRYIGSYADASDVFEFFIRKME
jgi:hypothetical protein